MINDILILSNGNIVSCADDVNSKVWEFASGRCLKTIDGTKNVNFLTRAENDNIICCTRDGSCKLYNTATGNCARIYESRNVLAFF